MTSDAALNFCNPEVVKGLQVIHYGSDRFDVSKFKVIQNMGQKPYGGLWTCPINSASSWKDLCMSDSDLDFVNLDLSFLLRFNEGAQICMIDSYADLEMLPMLNLPKEKFDTNIDWITLSGLVDAVWLTEKGRRETRLTTPYNLTLWDCESLFVTNHSNCIFEK